MTDILRQKCELKGVTYNKIACGEMTLYPQELFFPFNWEYCGIERAFNRTHTDTEQLKACEGSYAVHFWNKITADSHLTIHDKTLMNVLAEEHCPNIYFSSNDFNN